MDTIQCPKCDARLDADALFCSRCGTRLASQATAVPATPAEGQTQRFDESHHIAPSTPEYIAPPSQQVHSPVQQDPGTIHPTYQNPPMPQPLYQAGTHQPSPQQAAYQPMPQPVYSPMPPQQYYPGPVQQVNVVMAQQTTAQVPAVVVVNKKSVAAAFFFTLFFGPLGMLYTTVRGAIIMLIATIFFSVITAGVILPLMWLICMIWGCAAARNPS